MAKGNKAAAEAMAGYVAEQWLARDAERAEAEAIRGGISETLALEAGRVGVEQPALPKAGPVLAKRDGIATLFKAGSLSVGEVQHATAFRMAFEAGQGGLKSCLGDLGSPGRTVRVTEVGADRSKAELQRAYLLARLGQFERVVRAVNGEAAWEVLKAVAGEGRSIRSLGDTGRAKAARLALLKGALGTVAAVLTRLPAHLANRAR